ncbi:hypothetical protein SDC9_211591 [bioreactor metagenome]|uniref:Uncharacterized protein n=1 Tax=bioreactor metagenome TaxID=1076179 RepID=A0A645JJH2_9ZZZZ|nr:hypothetical protein [Aminobacterium sp.]MEA4878337.1 hypothetical protein [Aminobacterium sp.]
MTPQKDITTSVISPICIEKKRCEEVNTLLANISGLAASIRTKADKAEDPGDLIPLLQSTVVLLETVSQKAGIVEEKE